MRRSPWDITTAVALVAVLGSAVVGAWATAQSVIEGDVAGTVFRFGAASLLGAYYFVLFRTARRHDIRNVRNALEVGDRRSAEFQHQAIHRRGKSFQLAQGHKPPRATPYRGDKASGQELTQNCGIPPWAWQAIHWKPPRRLTDHPRY